MLSKIKTGLQVSNTVWNGIVISAGLAVVGGIGFVMYKGYGLASSFFGGVANFLGSGGKQAAADNKLAAIQSKPNEQNPFTPEYLTALQAKYLNTGKVLNYVTSAEARRLVDVIYSNTGFFAGVFTLSTDTSDKIIGAFKSLSHKSQVSQVATEFQKQYRQNVLDFLDYELKKWGLTSQGAHADAVVKIIDYVSKLPE